MSLLQFNPDHTHGRGGRVLEEPSDPSTQSCFLQPKVDFHATDASKPALISPCMMSASLYVQTMAVKESSAMFQVLQGI